MIGRRRTRACNFHQDKTIGRHTHTRGKRKSNGTDSAAPGVRGFCAALPLPAPSRQCRSIGRNRDTSTRVSNIVTSFFSLTQILKEKSKKREQKRGDSDAHPLIANSPFASHSVTSFFTLINFKKYSSSSSIVQKRQTATETVLKTVLDDVQMMFR